MEKQQVVFGGDRFADSFDVTTRLGTDIAETVDVDTADFDVTAHTGLFIKRIETVAALFCSGRTQQLDVTHL